MHYVVIRRESLKLQQHFCCKVVVHMCTCMCFIIQITSRQITPRQLMRIRQLAEYMCQRKGVCCDLMVLSQNLKNTFENSSVLIKFITLPLYILLFVSGFLQQGWKNECNSLKLRLSQTLALSTSDQHPFMICFPFDKIIY